MDRLFFLFFISSIFSCNEVIDKQVDEAIKELRSQNEKLEEQFIAVYSNYVNKTNDPSRKEQAIHLFNYFSMTNSLIDSLDIVLSGMDDKSPESINQVKLLLADGTSGQRLKSYLTLYFDDNKEFVKNDLKKSQSIDSIENRIFGNSDNKDSWQNRLFALTNPFGASLILDGLKKEVYNAGIIVLDK